MNWLYISEVFQILLCILLVALVMIQYRGKGLTSSIGSGIQFYGSRRGLEKFVFYSTIVSAILFVANTIVIILLRS